MKKKRYRGLFNPQITNINHGFDVVMLTVTMVLWQKNFKKCFKLVLKLSKHKQSLNHLVI